MRRAPALHGGPLWEGRRPAATPPADQAGPAFDTFDAVFAAPRAEACAFYEVLQQDIAHPHERVVQRQALAGLLWSKQFYYFDVPEWLRQGSRQKHLPVLF